MMRYLFLLLVLLAGQAQASSVSIRVEDATGAPLQHQLVIVQNLGENEREVSRNLSDRDGTTPQLELGPGLYRVISLDPYGPWQTVVQEFLVGTAKTDVVLRVRPLGTNGNGDVITVGTSWTNLKVLRSDGTAASGIRILARDEMATPRLERWYQTDEAGEVRIQMVAEPLTLIIVSDNRVFKETITNKNVNFTLRLSNN